MRFWGGHIVTYPLLYALHKHFPNKTITVVARDPVGQAYTSLPWPVQFVEARGIWGHFKALDRKTDLMFSLHYTSGLHGVVALLRRPQFRLGFRNKRVLDWVWTHPWRKDFDEYMGLANMQLFNGIAPLDIEANARECFEAIAATVQEPPATSDIVIMPGGGAGAYKRWRLANFLSVIEGLRAELGQNLTFTFVLGPDEAEEKDAITALADPHFRLMMKRPLAEIAHVCLHANLVIANDCGPSHIAQGACVPYVSIMHKPHPQWHWERSYARCVTPLNNEIDIQKVTPDQVLQACREVWKN